MEFIVEARSVIFLQAHAGVETGDLIAVAIEHLRGRDLEVAWQADFPGLAPAWIVHMRTHVEVEAIFMRVREVPGCGRLIFTNLILTIDLMLLNPYFHGITMRTGALS